MAEGGGSAPGTRPLGARLFSNSRRPPACNFAPTPALGSSGFPRQLRPLGTLGGDCRRRRLCTRCAGRLTGKKALLRGAPLLGGAQVGQAQVRWDRWGRAQMQQDSCEHRGDLAPGQVGTRPGSRPVPTHGLRARVATSQVALITNRRDQVFNSQQQEALCVQTRRLLERMDKGWGDVQGHVWPEDPSEPQDGRIWGKRQQGTYSRRGVRWRGGWELAWQHVVSISRVYGVNSALYSSEASIFVGGGLEGDRV